MAVDGQTTGDVDTLHRLLGRERIGRQPTVALLRGARRLGRPSREAPFVGGPSHSP